MTRLSPSLSSSLLAGLLVLLTATVFLPALVAGGMPKWMILYGAVAAIALFARRIVLDGVTLAGGAFIAYAALSLLWSPDPAAGALQLHKLVVLAVVFLAARAHAWNLPLMITVAVGAVIALYLVPFLPYGGFGNENFLAEFLLAGLPFVAVYFWRELKARIEPNLCPETTTNAYGLWYIFKSTKTYLFCGGFVGIFVGYVWVFATSQSLLPVLVLLAAVTALCIRHRHWQFLLIAVLAAGNAVLLWPEIFWNSIATRLEISSATLVMWAAAPFQGVGFGGFNHGYPAVRETFLAFMPSHDPVVRGAYFAGAAHNEVLQAGAELGLIGLVLAGVFLFLVLRKAPWGAPLASIGILAVCGLVGFPLQNPATGALAAFCLGMVASPVARTWALPKLARGALVAGAIASLYLGSLEFRGQVAYGQSAANLEHAPLRAFQLNLAAYEIYPWDFQIRNQLYRTFANLTMQRPVKVGPNVLKRLYIISASAAPFVPYVAVEQP